MRVRARYPKHSTALTRRWLLLLAIAVATCLFTLPGTAHANTTTIVPNAQKTWPAGWQQLGGANSPNTWQNIDEVLPGSVNTGDYIYNSGATGTPQYDLTSLPVSSVSSVTMRLDASTFPSGTTTYALKKSDGTVLISGSAAVTAAPTVFSSAATPVNLTQADLDGLYVEYTTPSTASVYMYAISVDITYVPPTLVPNAERTAFPAGWGYFGQASPNTWQNVDEIVPGGGYNTGDWTYAPTDATNPMTYDLTTTTTGLVAGVSASVVVSSNASHPGTVRLRKSDGTLIASNAFTIPAATTPFTFALTNTYLTQADIDGMYIEIQGTAGQPLYWYAASVEVTPATVSGTATDTSLCDGSTPVIGIAVNAVKFGDVPCQAGTGNFAASPSFAPGAIVTAYYDGQALKASDHVRTLNDSTTLLSGLSLTQNQARVESRSTTAITQTDINQYDGSNDADIPINYPVSTNLTASANTTLVVAQGTFQPTVTVDTPKTWILTGATYTAGSSTLIVSSATQGNTCTGASTNRSFCNAGTFTPGTGTVSYRGAGGTQSVPGGTYYKLDLQCSACDLGTTDAATITATNAVTITGSAATSNAINPTINFNNTVTLTSPGSLGGNGTGTTTIAGNFSGTGDVNFTAGTVELRNAAAAQTVDPNGTLPGTAWRFATLTTSTSAGARTITIPVTAREIRASVAWNFGRAADIATTTVNASAMTQPITVTGNLTLTTRGSFTTPPLTEVDGNIASTGTLTFGTGTLKLGGAGTSDVNVTGAGSPYDVLVNQPSKLVTLTSAFAVTHQMTIDGGSCATPVTVRSSSAGVLKTITDTGATVNMNNASLKDLGFSTGISAFTSVNGGNTSGITFLTGCTTTVSGTVSDTSICDGATKVVGVAVNSTKVQQVPCTAGTGAYAATPFFNAGDIVTVYYDGQVMTGTTYTRTAASSGTPITNDFIVSDQDRVQSLSATPITVADINLFDRDNDPDITAQYPVSGELQLAGNDQLQVYAGTFNPGAPVRADTVWVRAAGTFTPGASNVTITGTGAGSCSDASSAAAFCNAGTFTAGTSTVSLQGTGATTSVPGYSYYNLDLQCSACQLGSTGATTVNVANNLTIAGTATAASSINPTINVTGNVTVSSPGSLGGNGTGTMTISGDLTGTGDVNFTAGSVVLTSTTAANTQFNATAGAGAPWQFATLYTRGSGSMRTVTIPSGSREIRASVLLETDTYTTLDASAMTQPITVTGDVGVSAGSGMNAPPLLVVTGAFLTIGTFNAETGTVRFVGSGTTSAIGWGVNFYDLDIPTPSKTITTALDISVAHSLSINGGSCTTPVTWTTTSPGTARNIGTTSATISVNYASFRDIQSLGQTMPAVNSGDLGNNSNITFSGNACSAPTAPYFDSSNATAGSTNPTTIDGRAAFHMSVVNSSGTTSDRFRTDVSSSALDSSVLGLWPLDGSGADRASTNNALTATGGVTYVSGATNFSQAASFDGVNGQMTAPTNAAYNTSTFTVEVWMRASGYDTWPVEALVARAAGPTNNQFTLWIDKATGQLIANSTAGGTSFSTATPVAPWFDNAWHHIAVTVDGSKQIKLYVDGTQYGSTATYTGTLDVPAAASLYVGATNSSNYFAGQLDDIQFSNYAKSAAELQGYAATLRPHAQSIWQSTGYGTAAGAALTSSCPTLARCSDIVYGGPGIRMEGARYYATHQLRTTAGLWSAPVTDWFQTSDGISVTAPGSVNLNGPTGTDVTNDFNVTTTCSNPSGCALNATAPSATVALLDPVATNSVPPITPSAPSAPGSWAANAHLGLGFTVLSSSRGKDTSRWGTGSTWSNLALLNFVGLGPSTTLIDQMASGSETTDIGVRLNAQPTLAPNTYSGTISLVALDAP